MATTRAPAIGIDLGTTYSCVGVFHNGRVHIIRNQQEKSTIPSYVAFVDNVRLVGERAKKYTVIEPENTVNNVKRILGRTMDDKDLQADMEFFQFKVFEGENGKPMIKVKHGGDDKVFHPEEISAAVLSELKTMAEEFLMVPVSEAVITVPSYFTDAQRQATKDAGAIAGLEVLGTINEPNAAALAYGFDHAEVLEPCTLLVYDFGGGTFDVSILKVTNGNVEVLATRGNSHLGGEDIDNLLVKHFCSEFQREHQIDLFEKAETNKDAKKAIRRLQHACEKAKITLSKERNASVDLDALFGERDLYAPITRVFFENLCGELIRKTAGPVMEAVEHANLAQSDVTKIVFVGGSTRIPFVSTLLDDMFPGTEVCRSINPDEAVAYGAAIQAAIKTGVAPHVIRNVHLKDVTPLSLGIETFGGLMEVIIPRGTAVPVQKIKTFTTSRDYQTDICFQVFEGERQVTKFNNMLGEFTLVGIPPAPRKVPQIEVVFDVDANGILNVKAVDLSTESENEIEITNTRGRLSEQEIVELIEEAQRMKENDEQYKRKMSAREQMEVYARKISQCLKNPRIREKIQGEQLEKLEQRIEDSLRMYELHQNPGEVDFEEKRLQLHNLWLPITNRLWPGRNHNRDAPLWDDGPE